MRSCEHQLFEFAAESGAAPRALDDPRHKPVGSKVRIDRLSSRLPQNDRDAPQPPIADSVRILHKDGAMPPVRRRTASCGVEPVKEP